MSQPTTSSARADSRWFLATFAALSVLCALPLLLCHVLPSQDAPNHFAIAATLARNGSAEWAQLFEKQSLAAPYGGYYALATAASTIAAPTLATRLPLLLYAIALPLSALYLVSAVGLNRWAALWSFPFVYGDAYLVGFIPYLLTLPLVLLTAAATVTFCREGHRYHLVLITALGFLALWFHPLGASFVLGSSAVVALAERPGRRRIVGIAISLLPAMIAVLAFAAESGSIPISHTLEVGFKLNYLVRTPFFLADVDPRLPVTAVIALLFIGVIAAAIANRRGHDPSHPEPSGRSLMWPGVAGGLLYFLLPFKAGAAIWLDLRAAPLFWLFVGLIIADRAARTRLGRGLLACVALTTSLHTLVLHRQFDAETAALVRVFDRMEPAKKVLFLNGGLSSETIAPLYAREGQIRYYSPYAHVASLYVLDKSGVAPLMTFHDSLPWIPLKLKAGPYLQDIGIADAFDSLRLASTLGKRAPHFDYLLTHGVDEATHRAAQKHARMIVHEGSFTLYRTHRSQ